MKPTHPPHPCPPNNPHCNGNIPGVQIDNPIFIVTLIILGIILILIKTKIIDMKKIYTIISNFLFGNKSCMPDELKSFR